MAGRLPSQAEVFTMIFMTAILSKPTQYIKRERGEKEGCKLTKYQTWKDLPQALALLLPHNLNMCIFKLNAYFYYRSINEGQNG